MHSVTGGVLELVGSGAPLRRVEDEPTTILLIGGGEGVGVTTTAGVRIVGAGPARERELAELTTTDGLGRRLFLLDLGGEDACLVGATGACAIPRDARGAPSLAHAAAAASAWRLAQRRMAQRLERADWLLAYADALGVADSAHEVHAALVRHAPRVLGAFAGAVLLYSGSEGPVELLRANGRTLAHGAMHPDVVARFARAGILAPADLGGAPEFLRDLVSDLNASYLLHAPLQPGATVLLAERRRERVFTAEDADLFQAIVRQAKAVLRRFPGNG